MPARNAKRLSMESLTLSDEAVEEFVEFLENKLALEDFSALKKMLAKSQESDEDEMETAKDEPPPFKNQPKTKTGGTMLAGDASSDANLKRYAEWFPDAMRIKQAW